MQFKVDLMHEAEENGQNPHFWLFFCTIYAHCTYLINYARPITMAISWETFRVTTLWDIKSIRDSELEKMAKNRIFDFFVQFMQIMDN